MADSRDITGKNRKFTGTDSIKLPTGTTGQRVDAAGNLRFNSTTNLAEYYDGTDWKSIDAPPTITGFSLDGGSVSTNAELFEDSAGDSTIVIQGSNFDATSATVVFEPESGGSNVSTQTITRTNSSSFTVTVTRTDFVQGNGPYAIKLTNGSGLAATVASAITLNNEPPSFATAADTNIGTTFEGATDFTGFTTIAATDPDGDTPVVHTISAGALPTGVTINSDGTLTGTVGGSQAGSNFTFTVQATAASQSTTRQFVLTVAPLPQGGTVTTDGNNRIHSFTSSGTFTTGFNSAVELLVVGGGAGGAGAFAGGGGGGGIVNDPSGATMASASSPYTITVGTGGQGGLGWQNINGMRGNNGGDSVAFGLTAKGGGGGGAFDYTYGPGANANQVAQVGGSGGGGGPVQASMTDSTRNGAASNQANFSGATSYGTAGGQGQSSGQLSSYHGGGGGGASQAGGTAGSNNSGAGGNGQAFSISGNSVTYAGGGGGSTQGGTAGAGGSGGGTAGTSNSTAAGDGTDGLGGGGGAGGYNGTSNSRNGGDGGDGIVIIKYDQNSL
jgi:hypothetical protein